MRSINKEELEMIEQSIYDNSILVRAAIKRLLFQGLSDAGIEIVDKCDAGTGAPEVIGEEEKAEEEEEDAWPGSPIEITVVEFIEGVPAEWLIEVPPADYEATTLHPYEWVDEVLSGESPETSEVTELDEAIKEDGFALQRAKQDVLDIERRLKRLEADRAKVLKEAEWLPAVRKVLLPLADNVRAMIAKLDRRITKVGLTASGRVTWAWDDGVDGEVPDQTGLEMDSPPTRNDVLELLTEIERLKRWLESPASE